MLIKNALVILKDGIVKTDVLVKNGKIAQIGADLIDKEILETLMETILLRAL